MSDVFLVLAQAPDGLSCFLVPRRQTGFRIERLKDKLGNRSNASAEIELRGAEARLVGEEGRGVQTIIEMVNHTRLDCVLGSTALQRRAVAEATHHAAHREAFGRRLAEQPLMQNVLADLCLESEAATLTALRLARAYDEGDHAFRRLATAVAKYWVCKVTPSVVGEALECLGGNGYVEESGLPRLYRESPLNSIWEGAGQRQLPRRAACPREVAREPRGLRRRGPAGRRIPRLDRVLDGDRAGARARRREPGALPRRAARARAAGLAAGAPRRPGRRRRRSARRGSTDAAAGRSARCRAGVELEGILERHRPLAAVA